MSYRVGLRPAPDYTRVRGRARRRPPSTPQVLASAAVHRASSSILACLSLCACVPDDPPPGSRPSEIQSKPETPNRPAPRAPLQPGAIPSAFARPPFPLPQVPSAAASAAQAPSLPTTPDHDTILVAPFVDRFERADVGADWTSTGGTWRLEGGKLCVEHARNHPIWLRRRLPTNARIEFDAISGSPEGDLKAEFWGDGRSAADSITYNDATSYLTIFGGWKNSFHVLARIDEHATDRPEVRIDDSNDDLRAKRVQPGKSYHFKVVRDDGRTVRWLVDDLEMLTYPDPRPLLGPGHDHFGFNDWDVRACFDNLTVTPLPATVPR